MKLCIEEATRPSKRGKRLVDRDPAELAIDFDTVGDVDDLSKTQLIFDVGNRNDVDDGERDLLAYARSLPGRVWYLCGPDNGTVQAMQILHLLDRMVSLEAMAKGCGHNFKQLPHNYSEKWLADHRTKFLFGDF